MFAGVEKEEGARYVWCSYSIRAARDDTFMFCFGRAGAEAHGLFQKSFINWMQDEPLSYLISMVCYS